MLFDAMLGIRINRAKRLWFTTHPYRADDALYPWRIIKIEPPYTPFWVGGKPYSPSLIMFYPLYRTNITIYYFVQISGGGNYTPNCLSHFYYMYGTVTAADLRFCYCFLPFLYKNSNLPLHLHYSETKAAVYFRYFCSIIFRQTF